MNRKNMFIKIKKKKKKKKLNLKKTKKYSKGYDVGDQASQEIIGGEGV
tara:strand:+ start:501 stop:644 length:144 start_codon:yes stop_codon:yes gene_type:complete